MGVRVRACMHVYEVPQTGLQTCVCVCVHVYIVYGHILYAYMHISYMCIGVLLFFAGMRMCMHGCICVYELPQTVLQICICVHVYILHVYVCSTVCCGYAYVYACMHLRVRVASHCIAHMCMNTCYCPSGMCICGYSARGCVYYCTLRQCVEECVHIFMICLKLHCKYVYEYVLLSNAHVYV